eukprot:4351706-Amphidinium_carterae.1
MLRHQLRHCKPRKSVPPWACPREAWLCVLDTAQAHNVEMNAAMEEMMRLIRQAGAQPNLWN